MSTNLREVSAEPRFARGVTEAAQLCGVSAGFIRKEINNKRLKSVRLGRRVLIRDDDLVAWLNNKDEDPRETAAA